MRPILQGGRVTRVARLAARAVFLLALLFLAPWNVFSEEPPLPEVSVWSAMDFTGSAPSEEPPLPSLEALEVLVGEGPELLEALAALERDEHLRALQEQRSGPKAFGSVVYGYSDEPVSATSEETLSYGNLTGRAGLSFPLLGTWNKEKLNVLQAEMGVLQGQALRDVTRERNLTALRKAYALIWAEGRRVELLQAFLAQEATMERLLSERVLKGFLLERDRLEFLSAFDMARRDLAGSRLRRVQALQAIRLATGRIWRDGPCEAPPFPGPVGDGDSLLDHVTDLADVRHREAFLDLKRRLFEVTKAIDREGTLDVGVSVGRDFPGSPGSGAYISFSFREPFGTLTAKEDRARLAASADVERERRSGLVARIRLEGELMEALALREYALAAIEANDRRLGAAWESLRVDRLRHEALAGDTLEKLQQSRYSYLRVALDLVEAQSLLLQTEAELVRFAFPEGVQPQTRLLPPALAEERPLLDPSWLGERPFPDGPFLRASWPDSFVERPSPPLLRPAPAAPSPQTTPTEATLPTGPRPLPPMAPPPPQEAKALVPVASLSPPPAPSLPPAGVTDLSVLPAAPAASPAPRHLLRPRPPSRGRTAYVWDAAPFLESETRRGALERFRSEGFRRMLLSFNADQIRFLRTEAGGRSLRALLAAAEAQRLVVDLLLGDPQWILPQHRQGLVRLVRELEPFPFRGLHLDLEPDSLPGAAARRLELSAELVRTVEIVGGATARPLSLSVHPRELEGELGAIVGPGLERLAVEEVAVMIYSTNGASVLERFGALRRAHPGLNLALAQSVEGALSPQESYALFGREAFRSRGAYLEECLDGDGFAGIVVQAWKDYEEMRP